MENHVCQDAAQQYNAQQHSEIANYDHYDDYNSESQDYWDNNKEGNEEEEAYNYEIFKHLESIIKTLIMSPAEFTILVPPFVNRLRLDENVRCQQVIATVMESAMTESNFLYNGARFCKYLDTSAKTVTDRVMYREMLYYQCKLKTRLQELNWQNEGQRDQKKCNGLILFLSELVAQMDEPYAFLIGELLVRFISKVLLKPASNSVKHICQALKLAGRILEKDEHRKEEMENMMRALTELVNNGQVDTHVGNMVNSVHELRKDWGRSARCTSSETNNVSSSDVQQQSEQPSASTRDFSETGIALARQVDHSLNLPVMYGPDGEILSAEESQFLQDHIRVEPDDQE
ncbi:Polyadenylate-binding protein-interacting protein [Ooceraea biroi]|nr:Polyadenylate-binding protein-interacting protein [Ooceraea biroi]